MAGRWAEITTDVSPAIRFRRRRWCGKKRDAEHPSVGVEIRDFFFFWFADSIYQRATSRCSR